MSYVRTGMSRCGCGVFITVIVRRTLERCSMRALRAKLIAERAPFRVVSSMTRGLLMHTWTRNINVKSEPYRHRSVWVYGIPTGYQMIEFGDW